MVIVFPPVCSDILGDPAVKLRPPVAEETHAGTMLARLRQVQRRHPRAIVPAVGFRGEIAPLVGDAAVAVDFLALLLAAPVGGAHGHARKSGVSGKSVPVRVDLGGRPILNNTKKTSTTQPD